MTPKTTDLFGTIFITDGAGQKFRSYYSALEALRPLFQMPEWKAQTTGFYLNVAGNYDTARISYFCAYGLDPRSDAEEFTRNHGLSLASAAVPPAHARVAAIYGGEEERFRRFLATYSHIGLDLIGSDLHYAQCLFATFRFQVFPSKGDYAAHFAPSFERRSPFYRSMPPMEKGQFWEDFAHWPNPPQVDWAHMFVNMILACDWNDWLTTLPHQTIPQINNQLLGAQHVFQIPGGWAPDGS